MSYSADYHAFHDVFSGGKESPKSKCPDGKIRSKYGSPPYARCMKPETASELKSLATIGYHTRVASADTSPRYSPRWGREVEGHRGNYKNPRAAVARTSTAYTRTDKRTNKESHIEPRHHALQTSSGLKADDFTHNRRGRLVSVKASRAALERYNAPGSPTKRALEKGRRAFVEKLSPRANIPAGEPGSLNAGQLALLRKLQRETNGDSGEARGERSASTSPRPKMAGVVDRVTANALREYATTPR